MESEGGHAYDSVCRGTYNKLDLSHQFYHVFCGLDSPSRLKGIQVLFQLSDRRDPCVRDVSVQNRRYE